MTWEQIHRQFASERGLNRMCRYLETKTAGLRPAFNLMAARRQGLNGVHP